MTRLVYQGRGYRSRSRLFWTALVTLGVILLGVALFLVLGRNG